MLITSFTFLKCITNDLHNASQGFGIDFEKSLENWNLYPQIPRYIINTLVSFIFSQILFYFLKCFTNDHHSTSQGFQSDFGKSLQIWNLYPWIRGTNYQCCSIFQVCSQFSLLSLKCFTNGPRSASQTFWNALTNLQQMCICIHGAKGPNIKKKLLALELAWTFSFLFLQCLIIGSYIVLEGLLKWPLKVFTKL